MEHSFLCFLRGLFYTGSLFVFSFFTVLGVQKLISNYKEELKAQESASAPPEQKEPAPQKVQKPTKRKTIKSIEINPDEFDRIYVKKS